MAAVASGPVKLDVDIKPALPTSVRFGTAGAGGIGAWVLIHPFNTVAVRLNLLKTAPSNPLSFARSLVQSEGVSSLYRGLSAGIARQVFYATSRMGLYEVFRDQLAMYREVDLWGRIGAGCLSGACAALISCPAEVSLVRMSNDNALPAAQRRGYTSVLNAGFRIASEEGVFAFWRGCMPFVNRAVVVGASQMATYDQFREFYAGLGTTHGSISNTFCAAMSAGLIYSLITMPLESAKNRMAFQRPLPDGSLKYRTTIQTLRTVVKADGILSLWNGYFPYYVRCGGHTVLMFILVEQLRETSREIMDY